MKEDSPLSEVKLLVIIAGFLGSVLSLAFLSQTTIKTAVMSFIAGMGCAVFGTMAVDVWLELPNALEYLLAFLFGTSGMAIVAILREKLISRAKALELTAKSGKRTDTPEE